MITRYCLVPLALAGVLLIDLSAAQAQPLPTKPTGRPPTRPTVSPYLNLTNRRGGSAAINYYGIVRPQQEFYREVRRLENDLTEQREEVRALENETALPATGHGASFQNYSHFYNFGDSRPGGGINLGRPTSSSSRSSSRSTPISTAPRPIR